MNLGAIQGVRRGTASLRLKVVCPARRKERRPKSDVDKIVLYSWHSLENSWICEGAAEFLVN